MLLRSSAPVYPSIHLLTLGATCRYAISAEDSSIALSDPGASIHVNHLEERLQRLNLRIEDVSRVLVTHLDADRIAGIPLLRKRVPGIRMYGTSAMHAQLQDESFVRELWQQDQEIAKWFPSPENLQHPPFEEFRAGLKIDTYLVESDVIALDDELAIRAITTPGHRKHSVSYLVVPHEFIITDETFGYNQGRRLCAPGGDFDLKAALHSVKRFSHLEISGIGFPYVGAITGDLVKKHLDMLETNTNDLLNEVKQAVEAGMSEQEIKTQVQEAFYTSSLRDPCLVHSLSCSLQHIWKQVYQS